MTTTQEHERERYALDCAEELLHALNESPAAIELLRASGWTASRVGNVHRIVAEARSRCTAYGE